MFISPSIHYFNIFGFNIYIYGIILAFSIFIALFITDKVAKEEYDYSFIYEDSVFLIISGLICARLYYCLINYNTYIETPLRILNLREGGISIHGAIIGGLLAVCFLSKKHKINFFKLCDLYALSLPLAQAIGRWGNYFNSEAYGLPTNTILKLYIEPKYRLEEYMQYDYFHPTFLYESVLNLILFIFLYFFILKKFKNNYGVITGFYFIFYGLIRLFIEPLRIDCTTYISNIPFPTIISSIMFLIGCLIIYFALKSKNSSSI